MQNYACCMLQGQTPLHVAAASGSANHAEALLRNGADGTAQDMNVVFLFRSITAWKNQP